MDFSSRIKKEMTEGIVRAILEDAGYRVIDSGIEKFIRELSVLLPEQYKTLGFPDAMSHLPDFTVLTQEQDRKYFVEVKYRRTWDKSIFDQVEDQVKLFGSLVLVSINATPKNPNNLKEAPSRYLRCCELKFDAGQYMIHQRKDGEHHWNPVSSIGNGDGLWWSMSPLQEIFTSLRRKASPAEIDSKETSLFKAIDAIKGILD
ncbi:MAG: hypothetical protein J0I24_15875 [Thiomonas arsenitoxydans]|jgi:Holliday junction resolvase-like predicted endonuclease|uniref:Uncharacterized protein n=1 Tax=Thiomonas arsenitoxydans (strain DSM 22701 / CIP 110005 / 3As) TaxID=426114 RepID=A0A8I1MZ54_THIA3|nr:hypothetical protein [Thiomonas arsenitoxydans]MBN8745750.1 hypothetical protein [Thiomonas arsenitoxydans]